VALPQANLRQLQRWSQNEPSQECFGCEAQNDVGVVGLVGDIMGVPRRTGPVIVLTGWKLRATFLPGRNGAVSIRPTTASTIDEEDRLAVQRIELDQAKANKKEKLQKDNHVDEAGRRAFWAARAGQVRVQERSVAY